MKLTLLASASPSAMPPTPSSRPPPEIYLDGTGPNNGQPLLVSTPLVSQFLYIVNHKLQILQFIQPCCIYLSSSTHNCN